MLYTSEFMLSCLLGKGITEGLERARVENNMADMYWKAVYSAALSILGCFHSGLISVMSSRPIRQGWVQVFHRVIYATGRMNSCDTFQDAAAQVSRVIFLGVHGTSLCILLTEVSSMRLYLLYTPPNKRQAKDENCHCRAGIPLERLT